LRLLVALLLNSAYVVAETLMGLESVQLLLAHHLETLVSRVGVHVVAELQKLIDSIQVLFGPVDSDVHLLVNMLDVGMDVLEFGLQLVLAVTLDVVHTSVHDLGELVAEKLLFVGLVLLLDVVFLLEAVVDVRQIVFEFGELLIQPLAFDLVEHVLHHFLIGDVCGGAVLELQSALGEGAFVVEEGLVLKFGNIAEDLCEKNFKFLAPDVEEALVESALDLVVWVVVN